MILRINTKINLCLVFILLSSMLFSYSYADEDINLDLEFSIQQKSTLDTFPLKEIDQDSLSDMVIEGALLVQSNNADGIAKPVHEKVKEESDKNKAKSTISDGKSDILSESDTLKFSQSLPVIPQIQPVYSEPTGRTYADHQTTTTFRP